MPVALHANLCKEENISTISLKKKEIIFKNKINKSLEKIKKTIKIANCKSIVMMQMPTNKLIIADIKTQAYCEIIPDNITIFQAAELLNNQLIIATIQTINNEKPCKINIYILNQQPYLTMQFFYKDSNYLMVNAQKHFTAKLYGSALDITDNHIYLIDKYIIPNESYFNNIAIGKHGIMVLEPKGWRLIFINTLERFYAVCDFKAYQKRINTWPANFKNFIYNKAIKDESSYLQFILQEDTPVADKFSYILNCQQRINPDV